MEEIIKKGIQNKLFYPPDICSCGNTKISLNKLNRNKNTSFCFRCSRKSCKKIYPLRKDSFFEKFKYIPLNDCFLIIDCFINLKFNVKRAYNYLTENKHFNISEKNMGRFYREMRKVIYSYYLILYTAEEFSDENTVDESDFTKNRRGEQIWILGIIDNVAKDFRTVASKTRDGATLKEFINRFIKRGNYIVSDGWSGYERAEEENSGYNHIKHIHGHRDFGYGIESTSHVESIWSQLKAEIKSIYYFIPLHNF